MERALPPESRYEGSADGARLPSATKPSRTRTPLPERDVASVGEPEAGAAGDRYRELALLGVGGMGEVRAVHDELLGREVALKTLRSDLVAGMAARRQFEHELRLQARLEHPSIVPVYDIGRTPDGRTFFTMKKVRGITLYEILERIHAGDEAVRKAYPRRRLVDALARATLAVDYAHVLGVIHRDLKPSNLMLGDFGEVYILDWGIAVDTWFPVLSGATAAEREASDETGHARDAATADPLASLRSSQQIGTPGYAAPEQIAGAAARVSVRSDVWSLGAVLYEVLAGVPYVGGETPSQRAAATIDAPDPRPSLRAPDHDIAPELDAICVQALAYDPADRFGTAHELHQALQRHLDGERDLELRASLAARHLAEADAAVDRALERADESALAERARAMKEIGRALALDPEDPRAFRVMVRLLGEKPRHVPPQVKAEFEKGANELLRRAFQLGSLCYLSWVVCIPACLWMGVRSGWLLAFFMLTTVATSGYAFLSSKQKVISPARQYGMLVVTSLSLATASRGFGPLVLVPTAVAVNMLSFAMSESRRRRVAFVVIGTGIGIVAPVLLEALGILPPSYAFRDGVIQIMPQALSFTRGPALTVLLFANLAIIVAAAAWVGILRDELDRRDVELLLRKWHLAQMLPEEPSTADLRRKPEC
ncbi:MAG: serine/threonine-protein kinase [bacterium]